MCSDTVHQQAVWYLMTIIDCICDIVLFCLQQFTRRHHCRRCGRVFCAACSSRTAPVRGRSVRVCDECYDLMFKHRQPTGSPGSQAKRAKDKLSGKL